MDVNPLSPSSWTEPERNCKEVWESIPISKSMARSVDRDVFFYLKQMKFPHQKKGGGGTPKNSTADWEA